jgi:hypothetical protein
VTAALRGRRGLRFELFEDVDLGLADDAEFGHLLADVRLRHGPLPLLEALPLAEHADLVGLARLAKQAVVPRRTELLSGARVRVEPGVPGVVVRYSVLEEDGDHRSNTDVRGGSGETYTDSDV